MTAIEAFAAAVGDRGPVAVVGARTRWLVGGPLPDGVRTVRAPVGVVEHRPEEMTVRVLAGTSVEELASVVAATGQRCALPDRGGTVGGALAVGENHLDVLARGRVRTIALQVKYVSADGRVISGGGPTVKNVTGFDLPRMIVGSLGTLGLVAEATLRTQPRPAESRWLVALDVDPFDVFARVGRRSTVLWDRNATWVHLEGHGVDVRERARALPGVWDHSDGPPLLPPYRWSLRPGDLRALAATGPERFVASIGVGTVFASSARSPVAPGPAVLALHERAKHAFDPTGRLNPGREPWRR
jgi:FAD/FMN-containing dehydrogenase